MKTGLMFALFIGVVLITACAKQPDPIGGQKDEQGCLTGAGYSWDADIGACTRSWEIKGDLAKAAKVVILPMSARPITVLEVIPLDCTGCYDVKIQVGESGPLNTIRLANWSHCGDCPQYSPPAPGWCAEGTQVASEPDGCGCRGPPRCLKTCSTEAKICPDGSSVGRDAENNCEFAPCSSQMANPASVFCEEQGGTVKLVDTEEGQQGICVLKDGRECDEWAYFRGECPHTCTEEEKAAEACTMDYNPVCGDDGVTYGNACTACASKKISTWTPGECHVG